MAFCSNCRAENPDGATFCSACGARMGTATNTAPASSAPTTMTATPAYSSTSTMGMSATATTTTGDPRHNGKATASLVLGIIGLFAWFIPLFGAPITIVGLILGVMGQKSEKKGMATAGIVLSILGLIGTIINGIAGVIIGLSAFQEFM